MVAFSRVTLIGSSRRVDVSLPEGVPVAELLPELVRMLDESSDGAPARWALVRVGGQALDPERSLAEQEVASGTMLFLRDQALEITPPVVDDFAQQVAVAVDAESGQWAADMFHWIAAGAAAACLFVAGVALLLAGEKGLWAAVAVAGAAVTSLGAVTLVRLAGRRGLAGLLVYGSLPLWAASGEGLAAIATADATGALAAALAGTGLGAGVAWLVSGDLALVASGGVMAAALPPAVVLAGCDVFGHGVVAGAAVDCPVGLALIALAAPLAARLTGVTDAAAPSLEERVARGRRVLGAIVAGTAVMVAASTTVLAVAGGWFAWSLVAVTACGMAAQSRHYRFLAEVAPLLAAALASLLVLEIPLLVHAGLGVAATVLIGDGLVLGAVAGLVRVWSLPAALIRRLRLVEWVAIAASVPLALGALGTYDAVIHFARGL